MRGLSVLLIVLAVTGIMCSRTDQSTNEENSDMNSENVKTQTATFGEGCFWGVEETFRKVPGVIHTSAGFMGGTVANPTYIQVCGHNTGHAEVVHMEYDPQKVTYEKLLEIFWSTHDPTTPNRQGPDVGSQYRSVIFYHTEEQKEQALRSLLHQQESGRFKRPIVTEITAAGAYYPAEEYHQKYYMKRGISSCPRQ